MGSSYYLGVSYCLWLLFVVFPEAADDAFYTPYCDDLRRVFHLLWYVTVFMLSCIVNYEVYFGRHGVFPLNG